MRLIICEKPSLAMNVVKAIGNMNKNDGYFENNDYIVTFAFGHLLSLQDIDDYFNREKTKWSLEELPFVPNEFKFKLKDDSGVKKQFKIIKTLVKRKDVVEIINCGDADREGEVIINNIIYDIFKSENINKRVTRLWLPEQTKDTIIKQLRDCKDIYNTKNLYNEGLGRTYIDWLYGINLTRYMTVKTKNLFPIGRVLVPVVQYIYDRDMKIKNFKPVDYYLISTMIQKDQEEIKLNFKDLKYDDVSVDTKNKALELINSLSSEKVVVDSIETKEVAKTRPKLFSLDTLQNYLFKKEKLSLADTLKYVQTLYEKGYVTYPRTNTEYLAENEKEKIKGILNVLNDNDLEFMDKKSIFDDSKIESHSALTITNIIPKETDFGTEMEKLVYNTILNRFRSVFCKNEAIIQETKVHLKLGDYCTELTGNTITQLGYLKYEPIKDKVLHNFIEKEEFIPNMKLDVSTTQPPKKVTEAELNSYLKNPLKKEEMSEEEEYRELLEGIEIGTVATRSGIIENAVRYDYISKSKSTLSITSKGMALIENLKKLNIDMNASKTVEISKKLKKIYKNELTISDLVSDINNQLESYIDKEKDIDTFQQEKEVIGICPKCKKNVLENEKSFYCEDYKNCNFSVWKKNKFFDSIGLKKFTRSNMKSCLTKGYFEAKGLTSKSGKTYNAKLVMEVTDKYVNWKMEFGGDKQWNYKIL